VDWRAATPAHEIELPPEVVETVANRAAVSFDIRAKLIRSFSSVGWRVESAALRKAACGTRIRDCVLMNPFKAAYRRKP
jgi:hypothetical protein